MFTKWMFVYHYGVAGNDLGRNGYDELSEMRTRGTYSQ